MGFHCFRLAGLITIPSVSQQPGWSDGSIHAAQAYTDPITLCAISRICESRQLFPWMTPNSFPGHYSNQNHSAVRASKAAA